MASLVVAAGCVFSSGGWAQQAPKRAEPKRSELKSGPVELKTVDLSPRFFDFYEATKAERNPDQRFALWKEKYGFAAVPPGPQGEAISRRLLDGAWAKYPGALKTIEASSAGISKEALQMVQKVGATLGLSGPIKLRVVGYVGGFEGNAFTLADGDTEVVNVPLELTAHEREALFAHEMTHAVHIKVAQLSGGWERTIGTTAFQEGLAIEVAREVAPGRDLREYTEATFGWLDKCRQNEAAILKGILPFLEKKDGDTVMKFTMGSGTTGLEREAYYTGFVVMEHLHEKGKRWSDLARIPEEQMPKVVADAIREILAAKPTLPAKATKTAK